MYNKKQSKSKCSYIPPKQRRNVRMTPTKLVLNDENFPALTGNVPKSIKPNDTGLFVKAIQSETTPAVETKSMDAQVDSIFQSKVGRQIEENHMHGLWNRLIREDVQPRIGDDPNYDRYIHDYQVKYEQTFNQEEYSDTYSEEDDEEEETDEDE